MPPDVVHIRASRAQSPGLPAAPLKFARVTSILKSENCVDELGGTRMWDELVEGFTRSMQAAGRGAGTVRIRRHYLRLLERHCPDPLAVTHRDLEDWLAGGHWRPQTRKSARTSVMMFYRWAVSTGQLTTSPAERLLTVTIPRSLPRPTPEDIYWQAYDAADQRVRLMLSLARHAALRCTEICKVRGDDLEDGDVLRVTGKGGHERFVPIVDLELLAALKASRGYLFPGDIDGHLSAAYVSKLCSRALPGKWTAHTLRHAFASSSYARNPDIHALAEVLGHAQIDTTRIYALIPRANLTRVVNAARPRALRVPAA